MRAWLVAALAFTVLVGYACSWRTLPSSSRPALPLRRTAHFRRSALQPGAGVLSRRRAFVRQATQDNEFEYDDLGDIDEIDNMLAAVTVGLPGSENVSPELDEAEVDEDILEDPPSAPASVELNLQQMLQEGTTNLSNVRIRTSYPDFGTFESPRMSEREIRNFLEASIPIVGRKFTGNVLSSTAMYNFQNPPPKLQSFARWIADRKKERLESLDPPLTVPVSELPSWAFELDQSHPFLDPADGKHVAQRDELPPNFQAVVDYIDSKEAVHVDHDSYSTVYPDLVGQDFDLPVTRSFTPSVDWIPGTPFDFTAGLQFYMQEFDSNSSEDLKLLELRERGDWGNVTALYEEDDRFTEEDRKFCDSMEAVLRGTPHLMDHVAAARQLLFMNTTFPEIFLPALMPFPEINYTNTLMEFQTFKQLAPDMPSPTKLYENDTFTPAEDRWSHWKYHVLRRKHESWEPSDPADHFINETVVAAIKPVLNVVGNVMKLVSTKDDFFRYEYYGPIKEIMGMRSYVEYITKHVYPQCTGVRLETDRVVDEEDRGGPHWMETSLWSIDDPLPGHCIVNELLQPQNPT